MPENTDTNIFNIDSNKKYVRKYLGLIAIFISAVIMAIFFSFHLTTSKTINTQLIEQARAFFKEIIATRQWVAKHGGVYVPLETSGGVNAYLKNIAGVKAVITCEGQKYTLKNPALVTRELSESAIHEGKISYKITSLRALNDSNLADAFEKDSLQQFEKGVNETMSFEMINGTRYFRYMGPLQTVNSCLPCHASQGYKEGDIRGGISISIDAEEVSHKIARARFFMVITGIGVILLIIAAILYISTYFIRDLQHAQQQLRKMALYDSLTALYNRMSGIRLLHGEIARCKRQNGILCISLIDLDHFKNINDTYGHQTGDEVLKLFAGLLTEVTREYDVACRYGGEEFLIVMPGACLDNAMQVVTRLQEKLRSTSLKRKNTEIKVNFSAGITELTEKDSLDSLIARADSLLYDAKDSGRDQICSK